MTGQVGGASWPSAAPPEAREELVWELSGIAELSRVRADVRRLAVAQDPEAGQHAADLHDRLVLALDEMASNALRHGGGGGVRAVLRSTRDDWLIDVSDYAATRPPSTRS